MAHAQRLDDERAPGWLHVVVKREALAIRRSRQRLVSTDDVNLDEHEARSVPSPDERVASCDLIGRSAEALRRLKPQELRALWLRAAGHSYNEICTVTGWSYTKVNRCLTEGRRSFLDRYADIESGAECERWLPVISAMFDGEASAKDLVAVRPHLQNCPACRATLRALRDSAEPLAAVLPVPLVVVAATGTGEHMSNLLTRVYEMVVGGLHDRAAVSVAKVHALVETTAAGKAAAIAGAAAAVAGGGYATVERTIEQRPAGRSAETATPAEQSTDRPALPVTSGVVFVPVRRSARSSSTPRSQRSHDFFADRPSTPTRRPSPEFRGSQRRLIARPSGGPTNVTPDHSPTSQVSPEFRSPTSRQPSPEFGP